MSAIKNVTLVGASGTIGFFVLEKLLASDKFNVQVLKRAGSSSTYLAGAKVVEADFADLESLKVAFQGQDAVVSAVSDTAIHSQKLMIDAAIATGVKRFIPSNFGSNVTNPNARKLPVFAQKVEIEDYLIEKSKATQLTYSFMNTGGFTEYGIRNQIVMDFSKYQPVIFYDGETQFSTTSMPSIGDAVVGVLTHPMETRNRPVYVSENFISQNLLLSLAEKIAPTKLWNPVHGDLDALLEASKERFAQGHHDLETMLPMLLKSILDPEFGAKFSENDNELLGIKPKTEDFLIELLTPLLN